MKISAFVGRSFRPEDEAVCRKFCDFLDTVNKTIPEFTYETAKIAAPKELATKVREILDKKNLFIGICTKHHAVINETPKKIFSLCYTHESNIEYRCSNWIEQEATYSFAKGKEIILLVENGVAPPSIFGINREYILFDRDHPENSFIPLLQMIQSLKPSIEKAVESSSQSAPETEEEPSLMPTRPQNEWSEDDYEDALIVAAIFEKDKDKMDEIVESYSKQHGSTRESAEFQAQSIYYKITIHKDDQLYNLEQLQKKHPTSKTINSYLARVYNDLDSPEKAIKHWELIESEAADELGKFNSQCEIAKVKFIHGQKSAEQYLTNILDQYMQNYATNTEITESLILTLIEISKTNENKMNLACFTELFLKENPLDNRKRFELALSYSNNNEHDLSLLHNSYLFKHREADGALHNNLGVDRANLKLKSLSIASYQAAVKLEDTLAMKNYASNLVNDGYLSQAKETLDRAVSINNYDSSIHEVYPHIEEKRKREYKEEADILKAAEKKKTFYCNYAAAYLKNSNFNLNGVWEDSTIELAITRNDNKVSAIGKYKTFKGGMLGDMINKTNAEKEISITGTITGSSVLFAMTESSKAERTSLFDMLDTRSQGIMILNSDSDSIDICIIDTNKSASYRTLKRLKL
jgi:hypothetical protein